MERKKIKSECEFIGFKDDRLNYKCKECNDTSGKSVDDLIKKFPRTYFLMAIIINLFCYEEKVFILMSIWIARKDLMKLLYHLKKIFIAN